MGERPLRERQAGRVTPSESENPPVEGDQGASKIECPPQTPTEAHGSRPQRQIPVDADLAVEESAEVTVDETDTGASRRLADRVENFRRRREQRREARTEFAEAREHGLTIRHGNRLRHLGGDHR